jgi:hypothetical protein
LDQVGGLVEVVSFPGEAFGLELPEQGESLLKLTGEALAVEAEVREGARLGVERRGGGERLLDLFGGFGELVGEVDHAQGEEIGFEGGDAVEPPGGVGQSLDQLGLDDAFGLAFVDERFDVALVGFQVVAGEDNGVIRLSHGDHRGAVTLPWHSLQLHQEDAQVLPPELRKYLPMYTEQERQQYQRLAESRRR